LVGGEKREFFGEQALRGGNGREKNGKLNRHLWDRGKRNGEELRKGGRLRE